MSTEQMPTPPAEGVEDETLDAKHEDETARSDASGSDRPGTPPFDRLRNYSRSRSRSRSISRARQRLRSTSRSSVGSRNSYGRGDSLVRAAGRLTNVGLFAAQVRSLEYRRGSRSPSPAAGGPRLISSIVEYIHNLESRIRTLESKQDSKEPGGKHARRRSSTDIAVEGSSSRNGFKVKFFPLSNEVDSTGRFKEGRDEIPDTYCSAIGSDDFIRVAYKWKNESCVEPPGEHGVREDLSPEDIEVVALRIESEPVARFFDSVADFVLPKDGLIQFHKPFRFILRNLPDIRAHIAKLEKKFGATNNTSDESHTQAENSDPVEKADEEKGDDAASLHREDSSTPRKTPEPSKRPGAEVEPPHEREEAIEHLRRFLEFVEKYLASHIKIYNEILDGSRTKVKFENLWMVFGVNETLYCPVKKGNQELEVFTDNDPKSKNFLTRTKATPQAFRVVCAEGGNGLYVDPERDDSSIFATQSVGKTKQQNKENTTISAKEQFTALKVYCFTVDTDSERYTPVEDFFIFKPFDGEVEITSLEAYPLRFHPQHEKMSEMFLQRGRKYIELGTISHMVYEGTSIGEDKEEISGSVIIDFKLYYQEHKNRRPICAPLQPLGMWRPPSQVLEIPGPTTNCPHPKPCRKVSCAREMYTESFKIDKINPSLRRCLCDYEPEENDPKLAIEAVKKHMEATDFIRLLPGDVSGYVLRSRKWVKLDVNLLQRAVSQDQVHMDPHDTAGWRDLVLPPGYKDIVLAMVKNHTAGTKVQKNGLRQTLEVDLVKGKGKGCIILIHGAPGVGKTSTAECVAAYTRRPLFPITCGDVGYQPSVVEKNLDRVFNLAHRWGCVLLLDEADVFLAKRSREDIKRNGLVSIFLRTLEYYPGILFLTTNRVGAIDDAFRSRLHLTLYYPQLDRKQSRRIWKVNFRRLKEINEEREKLGYPPIKIDKAKILQYADLNFEELHWNGRQIRNAFQSALALAEFKVQDTSRPPVVSVEQFQTIAQASHEFDHYLLTTHGLDEDKMAAREKLRASETYKRSENKKLKPLPLSDESDCSSDSDATKDASDDASGSESESESEPERPSKSKKSKKKTKKPEPKKSKKDKKDNVKAEKKKKSKDRKKAKDTESDEDSDSDAGETASS